MDRLKFEAIRGLLREYCYRTFSYSGRGMYGRSCLAIKIESLGELFKLGTILYDYKEDLGWITTDNLGKDYVAYFPNVNWPPSEEAFEDET